MPRTPAASNGEAWPALRLGASLTATRVGVGPSWAIATPEPPRAARQPMVAITRVRLRIWMFTPGFVRAVLCAWRSLCRRTAGTGTTPGWRPSTPRRGRGALLGGEDRDRRRERRDVYARVAVEDREVGGGAVLESGQAEERARAGARRGDRGGRRHAVAHERGDLGRDAAVR